MKVLFGKFKGCHVQKLPDHYLGWLTKQEWLHEPLRSAVLEEFDKRCYQQANNPTFQPSLAPVVTAAAENIIQSGYRQLSKQLHPDVGGSHNDMTALNQAVTWLRQLVELRQVSGQSKS